jgi:hypothetical protein
MPTCEACAAAAADTRSTRTVRPRGCVVTHTTDVPHIPLSAWTVGMRARGRGSWRRSSVGGDLPAQDSSVFDKSGGVCRLRGDRGVPCVALWPESLRAVSPSRLINLPTADDSRSDNRSIWGGSLVSYDCDIFDTQVAAEHDTCDVL